MPFTSSNPDTAVSTKQHLNLSRNAFEVIENDMSVFGIKRDRLLNIIFRNFYEKADASISLRLSDFEGELKNLLANVNADKKQVQRIINVIVSDKAAKLKTAVNAYKKGTPLKFNLHVDNFRYLSEDSECREELYYRNFRSKYVKAVIEEYATLPFVERERIIFADKFNEIQKAIDISKRLKIVTDSGYQFTVYPYTVLTDPLATANYLVGYSMPYDESCDKQPCSFKISAIKSIKVEKSKSAFLTQTAKNILEEEISKRGVQFMVSHGGTIKVKLSAEGLRKYARLIHLRPKWVDQEADNIYVFDCTVDQAEYYFFKFGCDAEIIEPVELREKLRQMYIAAAEIYNS